MDGSPSHIGLAWLLIQLPHEIRSDVYFQEVLDAECVVGQGVNQDFQPQLSFLISKINIHWRHNLHNQNSWCYTGQK